MPVPKDDNVETLRFSWLLQPIRDLTKNWDIDVAASLEDYLGELDKIAISFDGGKTTMNFAEAALLIQGSACVYSKKVEYLYALVYQTLDLIASKKKLQQASSVDDEGKDKDVTFDKHNNNDELLILDDIKEAKNIDLKEDFADNTICEAAKIVPRTPLALLPTSEMGHRGEDVLLSRTGEVLGSRNDFKMNTCTIHPSGALLLDTSSIPLLEKSLNDRFTSTPTYMMIGPGTYSVAIATRFLTGSTRFYLDLYGYKVSFDSGFTNQRPQSNNLTTKDAITDENANEPPDDHIDVGPDVSYDYEDMQHDEPMSQVPPGTVMDEKENQKEFRRELRPRDVFQQFREPQIPLVDPWKPLDPYNAGNTVEKPLRKGKPFKIPASLLDKDTSKEKKRKRNTANGAGKARQKLLPIAEFCSKAYNSYDSKLPSHPLKVPKFPEFEHLFWIEYERRQLLLKKERKFIMARLTQEQIADINSIVEQPPDDDYDCAEPYDDGGDDVDDIGVPLTQWTDEGFGSQEPPGTLGSQQCQDRIEPIALEPPSDDLVINSYEDLVRQYVNNYLAEAQQYAQETDLSRRVKDWEEKIIPVLQEEEAHRPYDIHQYGSEILESFTEPVVLFREIMKEKKRYDVCRYFLSTLLLANNYNVEIIQNGSLEEGMDCMSLRLLHKTPAHKAVSDFRAPSLDT